MEWVYQELGRRARSARRAGGLTQQQVADRIGLSRTSVTNIELGNQQILLHTFFRLAAALGIEPVALLPDPDARPEVEMPAEVAQLSQEAQEWIRRVVSESTPSNSEPDEQESREGRG
jgi:transcriptional regulator with XRE-family HTH domain